MYYLDIKNIFEISMKKKKLDSDHVFLQFLMMFLALSSILLFTLFLHNLLWPQGIDKIIPITTGILGILLSILTFSKHFLSKDEGKTHIFLGIFFISLAFLTIFTTITNSLSSSTQRTIAIILTPGFLLIFLFLFFKKEWLYTDLYFWILFSLSLFIFSRLFFLQATFNEVEGLLQYSYVINLFGYLALTIGFGNELYNVFPKKKSARKSKKK
jgi:hypothetical protein